MNSLILTEDSYRWNCAIVVEKSEFLKCMKNLDVRKAIGPDGVAEWILWECAQLVVPFHIIKQSLKKKMSVVLKRANIVSIYKWGMRIVHEDTNFSGSKINFPLKQKCLWVK